MHFISFFHLFISLRFTLWFACVPLESPLTYYINLQIANHDINKNYTLDYMCYYNMFGSIVETLLYGNLYDLKIYIIMYQSVKLDGAI